MHEVLRATDTVAWTVLRCASCGERHAGPPLRHWGQAVESGACAGWRQHLGFAARTVRVTCGECLRWLLQQARVRPDWRPGEPIPEDHYAI